MTVCIAAACEEKGRPRIVLCSDTRIGTISAGADIEDKLRILSSDWVALLAGEVSRAEELIDCYAEYIHKNQKKFTENNLSSHFKKAVHIRKRELAEEYSQTNLGVSYSYFLRYGKKQLPRDVFNQMTFEISRQGLECELIVAGFFKRDDYIFVVDRHGRESYQEHFAAIGSGADIASSMLFHRAHHVETPLNIALYHVYEAKKLGETGHAVGPETHIDVLALGGRRHYRSVSPRGLTVLQRQYRRFGPRPVTGIPLERRFLERF